MAWDTSIKATNISANWLVNSLSLLIQEGQGFHEG